MIKRREKSEREWKISLKCEIYEGEKGRRILIIFVIKLTFKSLKIMEKIIRKIYVGFCSINLVINYRGRDTTI